LKAETSADAPVAVLKAVN